MNKLNFKKKKVIKGLLVAVFILSMITLISAQESKDDQNLFGWIWNSIKGLWENWFGGVVIETSKDNPIKPELSTNQYVDNKDGSFTVKILSKSCTIRIGAEINGVRVNITQKNFKLNIKQNSINEIYYNFSFIPDPISTSVKASSNNLKPIIILENCDRMFIHNFGDVMNDYESNGKVQAWNVENIKDTKTTKEISFALKPSYNNSRWEDGVYIKDEKDYNLKLSDEVMIDPSIRLFFTECLADATIDSSTPMRTIFSKWDISRIPVNSNITNASLCMYDISLSGNSLVNVSVSKMENQGWLEDDNGYIAISTAAYTNFTRETISIVTSNWSCINITNQLNASYNKGDKNFSVRFNTTAIAYDGGLSNVLLNLSNGITNSSFDDREGNGGGNQPYLDINYAGSNPSYLEFTGCQSLLNANMEYRQIANINATKYNQDCLIVSAQNITIDCQGYSIAGLKNFSGVYSNKYNTTVKNCNISMGSSSGTNINAIGIEFVSGANNGTIFNNTLKVDVGAGIYLNTAHNNNLTNNVAKSITYVGFWVNGATNNTLMNNFASSNSSVAYYIQTSSGNYLLNNTGIANSNSLAGGITFFTHSDNNVLINNTGYVNTSNYAGLILSDSNNNMLTGNKGSGNQSIGLSILLNSNNNTLINNTGTSNTLAGLYITNSINNILTGNIGDSNISYGFQLSNASNNVFTNNTGIARNTAAVSVGGITLLTNSNNNTFINNIGTGLTRVGFWIETSNGNNFTGNTATSRTSVAIYLVKANNNIFQNQNATGNSTSSYGFYFDSGSNNTIVKDSIQITGVLNDVLANAKSINNTFINCSYNNTKESVLTGGEIIRQWYYIANVTNGTGTVPISGANVTAVNSSGQDGFSLLTNPNGLTNMTVITEYVNNGNRSYYNNYSINASAIGYDSKTKYENITVLLNQYNDWFNLSGLTDTVYPIFYNYYDNNGTLNNNGIGLFNVSVNNTNGTVFLNIDGQTIQASNLTGNNYNVSYNINSGTYDYNWTAYGNGFANNLNTSETRSYTVNYTFVPSNATIVSVTPCLYKSFGYYDIRLPHFEEVNCI